MRPIDVAVDMQCEEGATKVRVHYNEGDSVERFGRSAEIVVNVDRRGLRLPEISAAAILRAEEFVRRILHGSGETL